MARCRVTIEYDYEDTDVPMSEEIAHWQNGSIDVPTINDAGDANVTVKAELID